MFILQKAVLFEYGIRRITFLIAQKVKELYHVFIFIIFGVGVMWMRPHIALSSLCFTTDGISAKTHLYFILKMKNTTNSF